MLISQVIALQPSDRQESAFRSHAAAARIARNDLIALWREEGKRLRGFRFKTVELRPQVNRVKYAVHPWFRELSQNAVKGGMIDAVDAIERYYRTVLPGPEPPAPVPWREQPPPLPHR